jgi:hypothetical protein
MQGITISERLTKIIVVALSISGVFLLLLLARISEVEEVGIGDLKDHDGETVKTEGIVIGQDLLSTGSSRLLITDESNTTEVFIERSSKKYEPGTHLKVTGDVYGQDGCYSLTVQSDSGLEMKGKLKNITLTKDLPVGSIVSFEGSIASITPSGWNDKFLTVLVSTDEEVFYSQVTVSRIEEEMRCGDIVQMTGFLENRTDVRCYGDTSFELLFRPEPEASSLLHLLDRMEEGTDDIPSGVFDISAYVKYEPSSRNLYITDEPEGTSISVKAVLPEPNPLVHKGDLISLVNSTLMWDPSSLRFSIMVERVEVIAPHGPWKLRLDNLEYGVSSYENSLVLISGEPFEIDGCRYLRNGQSSIRIEDNSTIPLGRELEIGGKIKFDTIENIYYLEVWEVVG